MRIGIFTDDFLPRDSGVVTSILQLRRGLTELGHEVFIIAPSQPGFSIDLENVIRLPSVDSIVFPKIRAAVPISRTTKQIVELNLDVVHSMTQFNVGLYADYIARRVRCPHVTTAHTIMAELVKHYPGQMVAGLLVYSQLYQYYFGTRLQYSLPAKSDVHKGLAFNSSSGLKVLKQQIWNLQNLFLEQTDYVVVPSSHTLFDLIKYGLKAPAVAIPNGIDTKFFMTSNTRRKAASSELRVVTVGRLSGEKRQDVLIKAVAMTNGVHLSIIGDGPSRKKYQKLANDLGLDSRRVTFYGSKDQSFIRDTLVESDIFAFASYMFDTQGLVLLEAAAAGLPVVYCDKRLSASVTDKASFYVGHHPQDFAELLSILSNDKKQLRGMGSHATKFAEKFNYLQYAKKVDKIYKQVLKKSS